MTEEQKAAMRATVKQAVANGQITTEDKSLSQEIKEQFSDARDLRGMCAPHVYIRIVEHGSDG